MKKERASELEKRCRTRKEWRVEGARILITINNEKNRHARKREAKRQRNDKKEQKTH